MSFFQGFSYDSSGFLSILFGIAIESVFASSDGLNKFLMESPVGDMLDKVWFSLVSNVDFKENMALVVNWGLFLLFTHLSLPLFCPSP